VKITQEDNSRRTVRRNGGTRSEWLVRIEKEIFISSLYIQRLSLAGLHEPTEIESMLALENLTKLCREARNQQGM